LYVNPAHSLGKRSAGWMSTTMPPEIRKALEVSESDHSFAVSLEPV
jgi:hypothetical protein